MARSIPDWPRMMRKVTAAAYCDMSVAEFERGVQKGRLPLPVKVVDQELWSRISLDQRLERLAGDGVPDWRKEQPLYNKNAA